MVLLVSLLQTFSSLFLVFDNYYYSSFLNGLIDRSWEEGRLSKKKKGEIENKKTSKTEMLDMIKTLKDLFHYYKNTISGREVVLFVFEVC